MRNRYSAKGSPQCYGLLAIGDLIEEANVRLKRTSVKRTLVQQGARYANDTLHNRS